MIDRGNTTLREIAKGTGISEKKVSRYYKGEINLSADEEAKISAFLSEKPQLPAIKEDKPVAVRKSKQIKKPAEDRMDVLWQLENSVNMPDNYHMVDTVEKLDAMCAKLHEEEFRILDTETWGDNSDEAKNPHHARICGTSIWLPNADEGYWIPVKSNYMECLDRKLVADKLGEVMGENAKRHSSNPTVDFTVRKQPYSVAVPYKLITHNFAFDAHVCRYSKDVKEFKEDGYQLPRPFHDTLTASWLLDETEEHGLKPLWNKYCCKNPSEKADKFNTLFGNVTMERVPPKLATFYAIGDVKKTWELYLFQAKYLAKESLSKINRLLYHTEMPVVWILYQSERRGLPVDLEYLHNEVVPVLEREVKEKYEAILRIYVEAIGTAPALVDSAMEEHRLKEVMKKNGEPYATPQFKGFNLNSNTQKQELVWDILKLTPPKSKKSEENPRSLDAKKVLKKMKKQHPIIELLLAYSKATKLHSAFAKAIPELAVLHPDGVYRVHPSIKGIGTKTLRMSQSKPNCQQIPNNSIVDMRNVFIAGPGRLLLSCDFSQQELRKLAHLADETVLKEAFLKGYDIHSLTASGMVELMDAAYPFNLGGDYVAFEMIRDKKARPVMVEHGVEKLMPAVSADDIVKCFPYEDEDHVRSIYSRVIELEDDVYLQAIAFFEKVRKDAKVVNFGIVYGMTEIGLADALDTDRDTAKQYIVAYLAKYPNVCRAMRETEQEINRNHFVEIDGSGAKRRFQDTFDEVALDKSKKWKLGSAYRMGFNCKIQGRSAFETKVAVIDVYYTYGPEVVEDPAEVVMPMNYVHDEIIYDVDPSISREKIQDIQQIMQTADPISIPMKSDAEIGRRWGDCRKTSEIADFLQLLEEEEGEGGSLIEELEEGEDIMAERVIYVHCKCGHDAPMTEFKSPNPDEVVCPSCGKAGSEKDYVFYVVEPERAKEDIKFMENSGLQFAICKCGEHITDLASIYSRTTMKDDDTTVNWYAHSCGHKFTIHTIELGAGSVAGKPVTDDRYVEDYDRYYYHAESDSPFIVKAGEELPTGADFAYCVELTKEEYEERIAAQSQNETTSEPTSEPVTETVAEPAPETTSEPTPAPAKAEETKPAETPTKGLGAVAPKPPVADWSTDKAKQLIKDQVSKIQTANIRKVVAHLIAQLPEYFWTIPASSSGKYHPALSLGEGGLIRHVLAGLTIMDDLLGNESVMAAFFPDGLSQAKIDAMRGAYILHDGVKQGYDNTGHTAFNHPNLIKPLTLKLPKEVIAALTPEDKLTLGMMMGCIESHMGQWNTDKRSPGVELKKPVNNYERFVHMIDYMSSRKYTNMEF